MSFKEFLKGLSKSAERDENDFGPWKPMPPELVPLYRKYLADVEPILAEKNRLDGEMKKLRAKLELIMIEFGVDMRRTLPEPDNDADHINLSEERAEYRCANDAENGVGQMEIAKNEDGGLKILGNKPPPWVAEIIADAMKEIAKEDDGPKTIQ